jgi:glycosyltransferase involved in cell wall biosynthesis
MPSPLVSVILPVRDGRPYLVEALRSMLGQTLTDLELIAIDDGSRDGSAEDIARAAAVDPRVRLHVQGGRGLVAALNHGLTLARGRYIARMDADDVALPTRLARQVSLLEREPSIAAVGSALRIIAGQRLTDEVTIYPTSPAEVRAELTHRNPLAHPTVTARRDALVSIGGYRPQFRDAEDFDLWLRLAERHDLTNLPEVLCHYRWHGRQSIFERIEQQALSSCAALACARARGRGQKDPSEALIGPVTWDFVLGLGHSREELSEQIAAAHKVAVRLLLANGLLEPAARTAEIVARACRTGALQGRAARFESHMAGFHVEVARRRPVGAMLELTRLVRADPGEAAWRGARSLARRVAGSPTT